MKAAIVLLSLLSLTFATVYFQENFDNNSWEQNWVISKNKAELGTWALQAHEYDPSGNTGLKTTSDYRFYQISRSFPSFSNEGETLVLQLSVANPQRIDCGGGYIKLLPEGFNQENFSGDSKYYVMFGPDICGSTRRVHAILNYKDENVLINQQVPADTDLFTTVYTFIINPDQTFQILVDNEEKLSGSLPNYWDVLPPKQIPDPAQSKPSDWVEDEFIIDTSATKPEGWDDIPAFIADPDATQPDDWDTELDGDWEAPMIPNPEYQGPWEAPRIPNPDYKGPWIQPLIDNPDYYYDEKIYAFPNIAGVGIEIWQVKSGTIFDNILITNDVDLAREAATKILTQKEAERENKSNVDAAARAAEEEEAARLAEELEEEGAEEGHTHEEL
jgi:calreticulin